MLPELDADEGCASYVRVCTQKGCRVVSPGRLQLNLEDLSHGLPGLTPHYGGMMAEAGSVCLEDQGHIWGVELPVNGSFDATFEVYWPAVNDQMRQSLNDLEFATEQGAYGVAILIILAVTDFTVLERSRKGTGFDYWLGYEDGELPFDNKARLEVSGIRNGDTQTVRRRVRAKLEQTSTSDELSLPAFVIIVEFGNPLSQVETR